MPAKGKVINGQDVEELLEYINLIRSDPSEAERNPTLDAYWTGESRSRIKYRDNVVHIGGEGELRPMQMLLASLAACDVDVIVTHAALLGLDIEELSIEAKGHFNVKRYLGFDEAPGPGYDDISYTVHIRAPGATPEQIAYLKEKCERASPVGDSLARAIPVKVKFETAP